MVGENFRHSGESRNLMHFSFLSFLCGSARNFFFYGTGEHMARVLAVQGSPRRGGNTHLMLEAVLEGAIAGGAEVALVTLLDFNIGECNGCNTCNDGCDCPQSDDMNSLYEAITQCDVLVLGTPVYWYGPTAILKAFVDRLVYFNCDQNRPKIRGKRAAVVIPYEETGPEAAEPLLKMFQLSFKYLELDFIGNVLAPGVSKKAEVLNHPDILTRCREMGKLLAQSMS
jgi:multimeric flavodoxin WrbA